MAPPTGKEAIPKPTEAKCEENKTRCDGLYVGETRDGVSEPDHANVMVCTDGAWVLKQACDASKKLGCMVTDSPSGEVEAQCVDAKALFGVGE